MRLGVVSREWAPGAQRKRNGMAKIIEFYIPSRFHKIGKWLPREQRGKVIEFPVETKKSA